MCLVKTLARNVYLDVNAAGMFIRSRMRPVGKYLRVTSRESWLKESLFILTKSAVLNAKNGSVSLRTSITRNII
jgi:hypothetical protein